MRANTFSGNTRGKIKEGFDENALTALTIISRLHEDFAMYKKPAQICQELLLQLIQLTESEGGFIGETESGYSTAPYLNIQCSFNIHRHNEALRYFGTQMEHGQHFTNLNTLFGMVILNNTPVLSNDPATDEHNAGFTGTTSIFHSFLGIPITLKGAATGMIALVNNRHGYGHSMIPLLQAILLTYSHLLHTYKLTAVKERLETAHKQLSSDLYALTNTLDDIVFEMDENKVFTRVWCSQEELLFVPKEEIIGKSITDIMGEHAGVFCRLADTLLQTGAPQYYEYTDLRQNLNLWYALKMSIMQGNAPGAPRRMLLLIQNITRRKRSELELRQVNAEFARNIQILDITQEMGLIGGWEFNLVTGEVFWTKQVYRLREIPENFRPVYNDIQFYHPDDKHLLEEAKEQLQKQQRKYCVDLRHISAKGTVQWVRTTGTAVYTKDKLTHFRGIIMNIDKQKIAEMELEQARTNAENAAKSRSDFLSVMSHEIRTPLNAIIGISGIMKDDPEADRNEMLHNLQFSANHLLGLVNDILDLSKIEAGKVELEKVTINIHGLIHDIAGNFQPLARAKGIDLLTSIDPAIPAQLTGDPVRLAQILSNLVNNAIKFTSEGGVTISVILQHIHHNTCSIHFKIKDTGMGIATDMHEQVFDTFVQGDSATTREYGGTGLGLAITRKLVALMNSNITIHSTPNVGTTFDFTIAFNVPDTAHTPPPPAPVSPESMVPGMRILVVEDNKINLHVMQLQLKKAGAVVTTAINGKEAILKMQEQQFDGIMLDLHMPEMNGYETIPHIKNLQPNAFIIVLTADIMPDAAARLQKLAIKDILPKPYKAADLYRLLTNMQAKPNR